MPIDMKCIVITYYYPPSGGSGVQRWMYFTAYMSNFGIEPWVITVDPEQASYRFIDTELYEKVKHVKVFTTPTSELLKSYSRLVSGNERESIPQGFAGESAPSLFRRLSRFVRGNFFIPDARRGWNRFAYQKAKELIEAEDIRLVITTGPPHSTHLIGRRLKRKLGVKWVADFRDPWVELYYNRMLYRSAPAKYLDCVMERGVLHSADAVLTIGPGLADLLRSKIPHSQQGKVRFIYNGYDESLFEDLVRRPDGESFVLCHTGILSENQPISSLLGALSRFFAKHPKAIHRFRFKLVGKVSPSILDEIRRVLPSDQVQETGYLSQREALQETLNADMLLNSFAITDDSSILVSGKLMDYLATGNPVIGLGSANGDAAKLVAGMEHVRIFDRKDMDSIERFIEFVYFRWMEGGKYQPVDITQYSRKSTAKQLAEWLLKIL